MAFVFVLISALFCVTSMHADLILNSGIPRDLILENSSLASNLGYDNCDSKTNGEYLILKFFLKEANTVLDVGAAQGDWSRQALLENKNIKIHAFEPIGEQAEKLRKQFSESPMVVHAIALGSSQKTSKFYVCSQVAELSSLHARSVLKDEFAFSLVEREVPVDTLDSVSKQHAITHIDFLKIDTEGNELAVLTGGSNLLQSKAIGVIQFEYGASYQDSGTTLKEVYSLLQAYGYSIFRITSNGLIYISEWADALENYKYSNYLAILNQEQ